MIELTECTDRCYADKMGQCVALQDISVCDSTCPFYKPIGCKDWVRVEQDGKVYIYAPEEYERSFKNEQNYEEKPVHWRIKSVLISKR